MSEARFQDAQAAANFMVQLSKLNNVSFTYHQENGEHVVTIH